MYQLRGVYDRPKYANLMVAIFKKRNEDGSVTVDTIDAPTRDDLVSEFERHGLKYKDAVDDVIVNDKPSQLMIDVNTMLEAQNEDGLVDAEIPEHPRDRPETLLYQMYEVLSRIDMQISILEAEAKERKRPAEAMRNARGEWLLTPLLVTKASLLKNIYDYEKDLAEKGYDTEDKE